MRKLTLKNFRYEVDMFRAIYRNEYDEEISRKEAIKMVMNEHRAVKECENSEEGHNYTVTADIGPDSGAEYFECKKCGVSHDVVYY